jgi:hypothetical protein
LPLDAYTTQWDTDTWTQTGWSKAHIRHLIDALRTWDYLPFCLLVEDRFLQDLTSRSTNFCSSALVHALLAISTRLVNEGNDDVARYQSGWLTSRYFHDKAKEILRANEASRTLPDMQANGVLALYYLRCGQEADAEASAQSFSNSIDDLRKRSLTHGEEVEGYTQSLNFSYCGALTLTRYHQQ